MTTEKVAVVTGAGSGLGRLITIALADQGGYVVDGDSVAALFAATGDRFGRLDLLVNNAGTGAPGGAVDEVTPEGWQSIVAVNLTGSFLCAHHAVALMKAQQPMGGRIINNGSISAPPPRPRPGGYTVHTHGVA